MSGSPASDVNQRAVLTPERGGDKALVSQLLLSYDILVIGRMDHRCEHLKLPSEWEVWFWCVGLERSQLWSWMSPRARRHGGARAGRRNFSLQLVPHLWWLGAPNYTHVMFPGTGFSLGTFPLKGIAFSHPFRLILSHICWKGKGFSSSFWFRVVTEFKQVLP